MTQLCCRTCGLRFAPPAPPLGDCPACGLPLEALPNAADALGLRLFAAGHGSLVALDAAVAAVAEARRHPADAGERPAGGGGAS
jgi:hypothetical protein